MSKKFSNTFKKQAVKKALNRGNQTSLVEVADSLKIGLSTLSRWIINARDQKLEDTTYTDNQMANSEKRPQDWSLEERLSMIMRCAPLDDKAVNKKCRENGIYPHHIQQWITDFKSGIAVKTPSKQSTDLKQLKAENKALKKELAQKDRALAETAALLVLKKKVDTIWGNNEED